MSKKKFNKETDIREYRRKLIVRLDEQTDLTQTEIAGIVECSQGLVSQTLCAYAHGGEEAIESDEYLGGQSELSESDLEGLKSILDEGAKARGYKDGLWTRKRVRQVIFEDFGVSYTLQHISNILSQLNYTLQLPRKKDPRQDKKAVRRWKEEELVALKQEATTEGRVFFYADESSFLLNPNWCRTYAPIGCPPEVEIWDKSFNTIAVCGGIGQNGEFVYTVSENAYTGDKIVEFLKELLAAVPDPITLVWDGASVHFCKVVQDFLETLPQGRLKLVRQPSYSPELNASEQLWNYAKNVDLKNTVFKSVAALKKNVIQTMDLFFKRQELIQQFFNHSSVAFY